MIDIDEYYAPKEYFDTHTDSCDAYTNEYIRLMCDEPTDESRELAYKLKEYFMFERTDVKKPRSWKRYMFPSRWSHKWIQRYKSK